MEENSSSPLLSRMWRAVQVARTMVSWSAKKWLPLPPPPPPSSSVPTTPLLAYERQQSLLDCMPDKTGSMASPFSSPEAASDGSSSFSTATTSPATSSVYSRVSSLSSSSEEEEVDVDKLAEEFIAKFKRNISLELRYCSPATVRSPPTASPVKSPISPETYFNLMKLQTIYSTTATSPPRPSSLSIKWPSSSYLRSRPTVVL